MKNNNLSFLRQNRDVLGVFVGTGLILLIPWLGMQFSSDMAWDLADFVLIGALLLASGLSYVFATRKLKKSSYRAAMGLAVFTALIFVWGHLALGLVGDGKSPANVMYLGVLGLGVVGSVFTRRQPSGMVKVLGGMALAQMLVYATTVAMGLETDFLLNGFFAALWLSSALLFHRAATQR